MDARWIVIVAALTLVGLAVAVAVVLVIVVALVRRKQGPQNGEEPLEKENARLREENARLREVVAGLTRNQGKRPDEGITERQP